MVNKALAIITRFSWMDCREKCFMNETGGVHTKLISSIFLTVRDHSKDGVFEDTAETKSNWVISFWGSVKDCFSKSG